MRERPVLLGEHGKRRIVTHRADGFLAVFHHRLQQQLQIFHGEAGGGLALQQLAAIREENSLGALELFVEIDDVIEPCPVWVRLCEFIDEVFVAIEPAGMRIDRDHLAGADAAAFDDLAVVERTHAGFGTDSEQAVFGARVAKRAQAIAVEASDGPAAIEHRQRGRAIPRLHHGAAIRIERLVLGLHRARLGPRFWNEQRLRHRRRTARAHEQFEDIIECGGV